MSIRISENGKKLIRNFEGLKLSPYQDLIGVWTIGLGHTKGVTKDMPIITEKEAYELFEIDIQHYENAVSRLITYTLTQSQFDSLCSFSFNLGTGALQRSTLRQKLNRGDVQGAAGEFHKWCMAGGKKSKGLLRRRLAEREMFLCGVG